MQADITEFCRTASDRELESRMRREAELADLGEWTARVWFAALSEELHARRNLERVQALRDPCDVPALECPY